MKKLIIATLILAGASTASFAQMKGTTTNQVSVSSVDQKAKEETDKWAKALNLTTDQKVKIQQVNVNYETQMDHIKKAGSAASPERGNVMNKYKDNQYQTILTADQYAKYKQMIGGPAINQKPMNTSSN